MRIETGIAAERVGGDVVSFDAAAAPGQRLVNHEGEEVRKLRRFRETDAGNDAIQFGADVRVVLLFDDLVR
ncbi:MAG: hypothetical protein EXR03_05545 [Pseudolabrys sp.]|nr:hypothetical protein [Pseudolabrys sp.]MSP32272.1 hypothetical protein [Pseudolabrys sp.]